MDSSIRLKREDQILLYCVSTCINIKNQDNLNSLINLNVDWEYIFGIALRHHLVPILCSNLNHNYFSNKIPMKIRRILQDFFKKNTAKNLLFMKEMLNIVKLLNKHGITLIPYKGPILAQQVYGNLAMRQFNDLDFFIKKEDFTIIKEILLSEGYQPIFNFNSFQERNYMKSQRELKFFHESKGIYLELHWKFSGIFLDLPSSAESIFLKDLNSFTIAGVSIPEISPENLLLILSIHNANHHWDRISWLVDIALLINSQKINWIYVLRVSKKLSIQKILFINLYLCQVFLDLKLDKDVSKLLKNDSVIEASNLFAEKFFLAKSESNLIENMHISMILRENRIDGIKDCLNGIFRPSFYELSHLSLPPFLFFLYYIYRPIYLLKRYDFK